MSINGNAQRDRFSLSRGEGQPRVKRLIMCAALALGFAGIGLHGTVTQAAPASSMSYKTTTISKKKVGVYEIRATYPVFKGTSPLAATANAALRKYAENQTALFLCSPFGEPTSQDSSLPQFTLKPTVTLAAADLISTYSERFMYDGSFGETWVIGASFGLINGKPKALSFSDLIVKGADVRATVSSWVADGLSQQIKNKKLYASVLTDWQQSRSQPDGFYLTKSAIVLVFQRGTIADRATGAVLLTVPYSHIASRLNRNGPLKGLLPKGASQASGAQPSKASTGTAKSEVAKLLKLDGLPDIAFVKDRALWLYHSDTGQAEKLLTPKTGYELANPQWISHTKLAFIQRKSYRPGSVGILDVTTKSAQWLPKLTDVLAIGYDGRAGVLDFQCARETKEPTVYLSQGWRGEYMLSDGGISESKPYAEDNFVTGPEPIHALDGRRVFTYNCFAMDLPTPIGFVSATNLPSDYHKEIVGTDACIVSLCPSGAGGYVVSLCDATTSPLTSVVALVEDSKTVRELARNKIIDGRLGYVTTVCASEDGDWAAFTVAGDPDCHVWVVPTDGKADHHWFATNIQDS